MGMYMHGCPILSLLSAKGWETMPLCPTHRGFIAMSGREEARVPHPCNVFASRCKGGRHTLTLTLKSPTPPANYTKTMHPPARLVAIDMDGTLLPTFAHQISPRVVAALHAAHTAGITIVVATGRRNAHT